MALIDQVRSAHKWLAIARREEAESIAEAVRSNRVVGVLGEADVGKTATIGQALQLLVPDRWVVELDLDGAASAEHLAFRLARGVADTYLGTTEFWTLKEANLIPVSVETERLKLAELLGVDGLDEALRDWPSGSLGLDTALAALEKLADRHPTVVWIDHVEAPSLTPRHPLDLDRLLWGFREMAQRHSGLSIVLSGREAVEAKLLGPDAAFHQQGRWLPLDNPPPQAWERVATSFGVPFSLARELTDRTGGHPETMLVALLELIDAGWGERSADGQLQRLASASGALAARAVQHANSLHRLGGQVLGQIALGQGPYAAAQRGLSSPQEIRKVLGKLRHAGLIRHDAAGWSVVNPLIAMALANDMRPVPAPEWELEE